MNKKASSPYSSLPSWFQQVIPDPSKIEKMKGLLRNKRLNTVCRSAHCPNIGQCWEGGTATFMILGETCTRSCRFCAVQYGRPSALDPDEPDHVAQAVKELDLKYVVVTSVTRDDLADGGADQFVKTIDSIRQILPHTKIEILIPDFFLNVQSLEKIVRAKPDVIAHNIETVCRLYPLVRPQADYRRSLEVLDTLRNMDAGIIVKSGFMVGLGETDQEIRELMADLLSAHCTMVTIGQYLAPTSSQRHIKVQRFVPPEMFEDYKIWGMDMGFNYVMAGPLVRSSYLAEEGYRAHR